MNSLLNKRYGINIDKFEPLENMGELAASYAIYKLTLPVRIPITLGIIGLATGL